MNQKTKTILFSILFHSVIYWCAFLFADELLGFKMGILSKIIIGIVIEIYIVVQSIKIFR